MPFLTSLHPSPNAASSDYSNGLWCQVVDADTQKAMLAWYYKKQEEEKVCAPIGTTLLAFQRHFLPTVGCKHTCCSLVCVGRVIPLTAQTANCRPARSPILVCRPWPRMRMMHSPSQYGPTPSPSSSTLQASGQSGCPTDSTAVQPQQQLGGQQSVLAATICSCQLVGTAA